MIRRASNSSSNFGSARQDGLHGRSNETFRIVNWHNDTHGRLSGLSHIHAVRSYLPAFVLLLGDGLPIGREFLAETKQKAVEVFDFKLPAAVVSLRNFARDASAARSNFLASAPGIRDP
jgi:hypothetical protein